MTGASGLWVGSWAAISEVETNAPGPALAIISRRSSSKADLRTMGRTEALTSCMENRDASSSDSRIVVGVILVEPIFNFNNKKPKNQNQNHRKKKKMGVWAWAALGGCYIYNGKCSPTSVFPPFSLSLLHCPFLTNSLFHCTPLRMRNASSLFSKFLNMFSKTIFIFFI